MSPDGDEVGLASKVSVKVDFEILEPFLNAMIGLENGGKEVEVLLGGVDDAYSLKALGRNAEGDFTFDQAPENGAFDVVGKVVFTSIAAPKDAREGNRVVVESSAGGPRVDPCFDYLKCFMFPKFFENFKGTAEVERGTGVKLEREKLGDPIGAKFLKVIRESVSKKVFIGYGLDLRLLGILGMIWTVAAVQNGITELIMSCSSTGVPAIVTREAEPGMSEVECNRRGVPPSGRAVANAVLL